MNNYPATPIARLDNGSIDYAHYRAVGRLERSRAIRTLRIKIPRLNPRPGIVVLVICLASALPLVIG